MSIATDTRLDVLLGRIRRIGRQHPSLATEVNEIASEVYRLVAGGHEAPPVAAVVASKHTPGPRAVGPKRRCPSHNGGKGGDVSASRFRPGKDQCRECERSVVVEANAVTVTLIEGDRCIGHDCPSCGLPMEIGERVTGTDLRHEGCR